MDSAANQRFHGNKELGKMTSSRQEIIKNGSRTPKRRKWRKLYQSERLEDRDRWKKKIPQYNLGTETLVKIFKIHKGNQKFPMKHGHALPCPQSPKIHKTKTFRGSTNIYSKIPFQRCIEDKNPINGSKIMHDWSFCRNTEREAPMVLNQGIGRSSRSVVMITAWVIFPPQKSKHPKYCKML